MKENNGYDKAYSIEVLFTRGSEAIAKQVGYGIEEEGLPCALLEVVSDCFGKAFASSQRAGLGVAVGVDRHEGIRLFSRQLKGNFPILRLEKLEKMQVRIIGKNAARTIKKKPFIIYGEE